MTTTTEIYVNKELVYSHKLTDSQIKQLVAFANLIAESETL